MIVYIVGTILIGDATAVVCMPACPKSVRIMQRLFLEDHAGRYM